MRRIEANTAKGLGWRMAPHRGDGRDVIRGAVMSSDLVKDAKEMGCGMRH